MRVAFVCRGYPGLGKVVGAAALDEMFRAALPADYRSLFLTYDRGLAFRQDAAAEHSAVVDLLAGLPPLPPNGFCTPFGPEAARAAEALRAFRADLVVNDGEPYLVDFTRDVLGLPTAVLAHPLDLHNVGNTPLAVSLFRHFYSRADLVLAHGLTRLPPGQDALGGRAGQVVQVNTLVRPALHESLSRPRPSAGSGRVVGVLGGGSKNSPGHFRAGTRTLGEWFLRACAELGMGPAQLFVADGALDAELGPTPLGAEVERIAEPTDNTAALLDAALVVGRAGRNLVSEFVALGKRGVVVPVSGAQFRTSGQVQAAEDAVRCNPNLRIARLEDGYDAFARTLAEVKAAAPQPIEWRPGNDEAFGALQALLRRLGRWPG